MPDCRACVGRVRVNVGEANGDNGSTDCRGVEGPGDVDEGSKGTSVSSSSPIVRGDGGSGLPKGDGISGLFIWENEWGLVRGDGGPCCPIADGERGIEGCGASMGIIRCSAGSEHRLA